MERIKLEIRTNELIERDIFNASENSLFPCFEHHRTKKISRINLSIYEKFIRKYSTRNNPDKK